MKRILILSTLAALLGGCAIVPLGYGYGDHRDGYYRDGYYRDGYYRERGYDRGGENYRVTATAAIATTEVYIATTAVDEALRLRAAATKLIVRNGMGSSIPNRT